MTIAKPSPIDYYGQESVALPDRRDNMALFNLVTTILTEQREMDVKLVKHIEDETVDFERMVAQAMALALPDGDMHGHRRHHEVVIAAEERKIEFYEKLKAALASWSLIGLLGVLVTWVWIGFLKGPRL